MSTSLRYTSAHQDVELDWAERATVETVGEEAGSALECLKALAEALREHAKLLDERDEELRDLRQEREDLQKQVDELKRRYE